MVVMRLTLDKAGRIVLPKAVRDELRLEAGDTLELETSRDKITLRPAKANGQLAKEHGVWVFQSDEPLTDEIVEETGRKIRKERDDRNWGGRP
jgi:AbrB family transcriptional regulator (stage V sporulation protein T)